MDYTKVLRLLAINDDDFTNTCLTRLATEGGELDPKTLALARIAALIAVGAATASYGAEVDAAISAGATPTEVVDVLVGVVSVVGIPTVVAAAGSLAMALGYDVDDALEHQSGA